MKIAIKILSNQHSNITRVLPSNISVRHEVNIGLILQYHVGLDKVHVPENVTSNTSSDATSSTDDDPLNDEVIAVGDEQITGGPMASMMSLENLEANIPVATFYSTS